MSSTSNLESTTPTPLEHSSINDNAHSSNAIWHEVMKSDYKCAPQEATQTGSSANQYLPSLRVDTQSASQTNGGSENFLTTADAGWGGAERQILNIASEINTEITQIQQSLTEIKNDLGGMFSPAISSDVAPTPGSYIESSTASTTTDGGTPAHDPIIQALQSPDPQAAQRPSDSQSTVSPSATATATATATTTGGRSGSGTPTPTDTLSPSADSSLSPSLQAVANQLGLQSVYDAPGDALVGYGGEGATAYPLSDYGQANSNGSFTINNDPTKWGGDLTPAQSYTGTQLDVATVQWNTNEVGLPTWEGGTGTSWPTVWGNTEAQPNGDHAEVDAMEQFSSTEEHSGIIDWQSSLSGGKESQGQDINMSDFNFSQPTQIATLINTQNDTETAYIDGQQVANFSWDPNSGYNQLATQPFNFILGTGNGEPFTVDNVQILTPGSASGSS